MRGFPTMPGATTSAAGGASSRAELYAGRVGVGETPLAVGQLALLHGLVSRPELNGLRVNVVNLHKEAVQGAAKELRIDLALASSGAARADFAAADGNSHWGPRGAAKRRQYFMGQLFRGARRLVTSVEKSIQIRYGGGASPMPLRRMRAKKPPTSALCRFVWCCVVYWCLGLHE